MNIGEIQEVGEVRPKMLPEPEHRPEPHRLSAIERGITAIGGLLDPDWEKNDLPWRSQLVQRAARECEHPSATATNVKGRFFREGMANMLVWLRDHPEVWKELAEEAA